MRPEGAHRWWPTAALALLLCAAPACGDPPLLTLKIVTPEGADPLAAVTRLRLKVSNPAREQIVSVSAGGPIALELELEVAGEVGTVTLEGSDGGTLLARGETPPMLLRPEAGTLALLVGRAGALSRLPPRMTGAGREMTSVLLPTLGLLHVGGVDVGGAPSARASIYDFYDYKLRTEPSAPEARTAAVGAVCGSTCGLVALGEGPAGLATTMLRFDGGSWSVVADGLSPAERRRDAASAQLGDNTYLVVGGRGAAGPLNTALLIDPGVSSGVPSMRLLPANAAAARVLPAVATAGDAVLVAGGQALGQAPAELFYRASSSFTPLSFSGAGPLKATAAVGLGDGRLAIVGGVDDSGALTRDAWIVDPAVLKVTRLQDVLKEPRAEHRVLRVTGGHLVVVGGVTDSSGTLATQAEVLQITAAGIKHLRQTPMQQPRRGFAALPLGPGSFLVAGGEGAKGAPASALEVYETSLAVP